MSATLQVNTSTAPPGRAEMVHGLWHPFGEPARSWIITTGQADGHVVGDIWALDLDTMAWQRLADAGDAPAARYGSVGGIYPGADELWLSHGFATHRFSDTYSYSLTAQRWTLRNANTNPYNPTAPHARCLAAGGMASPTQLVLYGGCMQNGFTGGPCPGNDGWVFDTGGGGGGGGWRAAQQRVLNARWFAPMAPVLLHPGLMLLYGGRESGGQVITNTLAPEAEVAVLNASSGAWTRLRAGGEVPSWRAGPALAAAGLDRWFMFGGQLRPPDSGDANGPLTNDLCLLTGDPLAPAAAPLDAPAPAYLLYPHLHGLFMFLGFGVAVQAGWMVGRYLRHRDPLWFHLHRALQAAGLVLGCVGFVLVYVGGARNPAFAHGIIGIAVMLLALMQPVNALLRPPHSSRKRRAWEWLHKGTGRLVALLALVNCGLGVLLIVAPTGVWIAYFVYLGVLVGLVVPALEVLRWRRARLVAAHGDAGAAKGGGAAGMPSPPLEAGGKAAVDGPPIGAMPAL